jgi:hypothetical protein
MSVACNCRPIMIRTCRALAVEANSTGICDSRCAAVVYSGAQAGEAHLREVGAPGPPPGWPRPPESACSPAASMMASR